MFDLPPESIIERPQFKSGLRRQSSANLLLEKRAAEIGDEWHELSADRNGYRHYHGDKNEPTPC